MRRAAAAVSVLALAACGGASGGAQGTSTTSPAQAKSAIASTWTTFFSASTPLSTEISLLQNGNRHEAQIQALHKQMPADLSARVVSVAVSNGQATVTYDLISNGQPLLSSHSTGKAVLVAGRWLVSEGTFCSLVTLAGSSC
ncbi:MAG TPA: hypothetical protein VFA11_18180 [Acidimicrobiales bacterium]|nr:hypothetical protein [Acidimicrobiales bacterium]